MSSDDEDDDELQNPAEAAKFLKVSTSKLAKDRMRGTGPTFVKNGRVVGYPKWALREFVRSRLRRSTADNGARRGRPATFEKVAPIVIALFDRRGWQRPPAHGVLRAEVEKRLGRAISEGVLGRILQCLHEETHELRFKENEAPRL
jgi:hypothetical protein